MIAQRAVEVSASVGINQVTIFGYTCPKCKVEISNPDTYASTLSDKQGFFIFYKILLPKKKFTDLCLFSTDKHNNQSNPTCIPAPPATQYHTDIGPILLAPTINLGKDKIKSYQTILSLGQAIPNSTVEIHLFKNDDKAPLAPKEAQAYSLPKLTIKTDANGNFNFNIPTVYQSNFRLFANSVYLDSSSQKSNTLIYHLPSYANTWLYVFLASLVFLLTFIFYKINKKLHIRYLPAIINTWPTLRNILLLPFSSSRSPLSRI